MEKTLLELAKVVGGTVVGNPQLVIKGVAGIKEAKPGEITFIANPKYFSLLPHSKASAVILSEQAKETHISSIRSANPYLAFAKLLHLFHDKPNISTGIHPQACIDPSADIGEHMSIHAFAVIGNNVQIGKNVQIYSGVFIGNFCQIGDGTIIYPNVTIYHHCRIGSNVIIHAGSVIGSDGFGYAWDGKNHYKIPQTGQVIIEDEVEIGAETAIDRGTIKDTIIKRGTKIDNLVQIAHNVKIGESSIMVSQSGLAGSVKLGKGVILGGQAAVVGHVTIGDHTKIAGKSAITKDVPPNSVMGGTMARPIHEWRKSEACVRRLPTLYKKISTLQKKVRDLENKLLDKD